MAIPSNARQPIVYIDGLSESPSPLEAALETTPCHDFPIGQTSGRWLSFSLAQSGHDVSSGSAQGSLLRAVFCARSRRRR